MIARPQSLAYQPFDVVAIDHERILAAYASDVGFIPQLGFDVQALVEHGLRAPVVSESLRHAATRAQSRRLARGPYAHNVGHRQDWTPEARRRLEVPVEDPRPIGELSLQDGAIVVLDAGVRLRRTETGVELEACDYPPFLSKPSDPTVTLRLAEAEATRLLEDPAWVDGWNPFVRTLAQYSARAAAGPALDVLMMSTRRPRAGGFKGFVEEWDSIRTPAYGPLLALETLHLDRRLTLPVPLTREEFLRGVSSFVEKDELATITGFDGDIFSGGWAFWLGAYYHCRTLGERSPERTLPLSELVHPFADEPWVRAAPWLKEMGFTRFGLDEMRRVGAVTAPSAP